MILKITKALYLKFETERGNYTLYKQGDGHERPQDQTWAEIMIQGPDLYEPSKGTKIWEAIVYIRLNVKQENLFSMQLIQEQFKAGFTCIPLEGGVLKVDGKIICENLGKTNPAIPVESGFIEGHFKLTEE